MSLFPMCGPNGEEEKITFVANRMKIAWLFAILEREETRKTLGCRRRDEAGWTL